jgi:hypothetical protein
MSTELTRAVVMTRQPESHGVQRLVQAAETRKIELHTLDPHELYLELIAGDRRPASPGARVSHLRLGSDWQNAAIIPRLGSLET